MVLVPPCIVDLLACPQGQHGCGHGVGNQIGRMLIETRVLGVATALNQGCIAWERDSSCPVADCRLVDLLPGLSSNFVVACRPVVYCTARPNSIVQPCRSNPGPTRPVGSGQRTWRHTRAGTALSPMPTTHALADAEPQHHFASNWRVTPPLQLKIHVYTEAGVM